MTTLAPELKLIARASGDSLAFLATMGIIGASVGSGGVQDDALRVSFCGAIATSATSGAGARFEEIRWTRIRGHD